MKSTKIIWNINVSKFIEIYSCKRKKLLIKLMMIYVFNYLYIFLYLGSDYESEDDEENKKIKK